MLTLLMASSVSEHSKQHFLRLKKGKSHTCTRHLKSVSGVIEYKRWHIISGVLLSTHVRGLNVCKQRDNKFRAWLHQGKNARHAESERGRMTQTIFNFKMVLMACSCPAGAPINSALAKRDRYNNVVIRSNQPAERRWDAWRIEEVRGHITHLFDFTLGYLSAAPHSEGDAIRIQMPRPDKLITRLDSFNIMFLGKYLVCVCVCESRWYHLLCLSLSAPVCVSNISLRWDSRRIMLMLRN